MFCPFCDRIRLICWRYGRPIFLPRGSFSTDGPDRCGRNPFVALLLVSLGFNRALISPLDLAQRRRRRFRDHLSPVLPNSLPRAKAWILSHGSYGSCVSRDSGTELCRLICFVLRAAKLTIRSSRDRFAARLHGDMYHSAVPRSGPA